MDGARALAGTGQPRACYALIDGPASLRPVYMHRGLMMECLRPEGISGHSSDPGPGHNRLEGMHEMLALLLLRSASSSSGAPRSGFSFPPSAKAASMGAAPTGSAPGVRCILSCGQGWTPVLRRAIRERAGMAAERRQPRGSLSPCLMPLLPLQQRPMRIWFGPAKARADSGRRPRPLLPKCPGCSSRIRKPWSRTRLH